MCEPNLAGLAMPDSLHFRITLTITLQATCRVAVVVVPVYNPTSENNLRSLGLGVAATF